MKLRRPIVSPAAALVVAALTPGILLALWLAAAAGLLSLTWSPAERAAAWALIEPRLALLLLFALPAAGVAGWALRRAWVGFAVTPARLAEELQARIAGPAGGRVVPQGAAGTRALAEAANTLLGQRDALRADIQAQVEQASQEARRQHRRLDAMLGALMAGLTQSVVVCNLDGRVLLFNARARLQFRALAGEQAAAPIGGAAAIGLGRSIYALLDRQLVAQALALVQVRAQRGAAHPAAEFVTATRSGQLLRVQMAPVCVADDEGRDAGHGSGHGTGHGEGHDEEGAPAALDGFVLMLDRIERDAAQDAERERRLRELCEGQRHALGQMQAELAPIEAVDGAVLDVAVRARTLAALRALVASMTGRVQAVSDWDLQASKSRSVLQDILGADLAAAAARRIEALLGVTVVIDDVDPGLRLHVDSAGLVLGLVHLAGRLAGDYGLRRLRLRLSAAPAQSGPGALSEPGGQARLDLIWPAQALSTETLSAWESEPMQAGTDRSPLSLRDVVERNAGALWFERDRARHEGCLCLRLPVAAAAVALEPERGAGAAGRPEFYDVDLFDSFDSPGAVLPIGAGEDSAGQAMAERPLAGLIYTVFDTETTGLAPAAGDRIIQIGAVRIVAGKLRRGETFEQLVDPERAVPPASVAIHGIPPEWLPGQPTLAVVLPAFHAFAQDSVLVAHNAAFDMRFLQLAQAACGVCFDQPVLDTLLLSALAHPQQASHSLEAIAARLALPVLGRHTALGDALLTAEIFLRLLPLLRAQGIETLGQALAASRRTRLARLAY